ncbi:MAG: isoprenyl synthetase [Sphingobacteriales bacterium 17-39-43]|uniref:polyprenyl synthetase family protein n=1 Tax=Daejeonella sp. TaxID=2805397 RepID=UPI000BCF08F8|nr:polyprenyl synthetase family protein [Daejeonella sp.]OYZ33154.1 MAG: isoprenyl synthetase [Sphingobacteriales bacterium 16-39-50]OZA26563.1 MAG: isoprenyl synthetase [Sphingobacteriales bacterium 17-39-43]HQT21718.1 polyprenyl synthetase family protein [Daejeonella sp.]HQT56449.1 polyprenyl synthetase family protein [Daejeonella sp.]
MHSIEQLQNIINKAIAETKYTAKPAELYEPISYLMKLGGKRMRPVLVLVSTELFGGDVLKALDAAVGIELFHNFTLMHDDIMDKAPLRRGNPTVHVKWNESAAILSGDVMFVEAYKLMIRVDDSILRKVLDIFSDTASGVCQGQQADMNFEKRDQVSIEEYIEMIRLKTAVLLAGSMQIGALIGGAEKDQADLLYEFGENLGLAFQLQDDILDVYGDPEKFGKQVGGDILADKKTFLLIKARELSKGESASELDKWLNKPDALPDNKVTAITSIYDSLGVRKLAEAEMENYVEKALNALDKISVENSRKELLRGFAEQLLIREH